MTSGASKEANKSVAKDSNADASTRLTAGKDALGDKMDESKSSVSLPPVSTFRSVLTHDSGFRHWQQGGC